MVTLTGKYMVTFTGDGPITDGSDIDTLQHWLKKTKPIMGYLHTLLKLL